MSLRELLSRRAHVRSPVAAAIAIQPTISTDARHTSSKSIIPASAATAIPKACFSSNTAALAAFALPTKSELPASSAIGLYGRSNIR